MPDLDYETDAEAGTDPGTEPTVVDLPTETGTARVTLPAEAGEEEVAALVAAVTTRLREDETETSAESEGADRWTLAGRLGARRRFELPRKCRRGGEWKAAARCP